jgi:hypothetical protein
MGLLNKTELPSGQAGWDANWIGLDKAIGSDIADSECTRLSARMLRKEFDVKNLYDWG